MTELESISRFVLEGVSRGDFDPGVSARLLERLGGFEESTDIAIIGVSCKFPGADDYDQYWNNIVNRVGLIGPFPQERLLDLGKDCKMTAGWLRQIGDFDPAFFRISPREAIIMHPEQRVFLEEAWKCLEDAGYCNSETAGSNVGVFVGVDHSYPMEYVPHDAAHNLLDMTGAMSSVMASRISFALDLKGPNMVIDTACSSGLVCLHQACLAIHDGEAEMALAGGLHLLSPGVDASFDGVESSTGAMSSFARNSTGTKWGEGFGFVLLKPAAQAIADRDHIYAIIRGSAINNDGKTNGVTAPSADTQAEVVAKAWRDSGINPEDLSYIEAHATGTALGDPIEVNGLTEAFSQFTKRKEFCALGSVKPNVGHGVSCASMASLIKVLMAMRAGQLPPNLEFEEPSPFIAFHDSPLYVSDQLREWEPNGPTRLAGVSSFGFGRTNVHVVLEEPAPLAKPANQRKIPNIFTVSGRTEQALRDYVAKYRRFLAEHPDLSLDDLCYTAAAGRMHFEHRLAIVVEDIAQLRTSLDNPGLWQGVVPGAVLGHHRLLGASVERRDSSDLTGAELRRLDRTVADLLSGDITSSQVLDQICSLYVRGANVDWAALYSDTDYGRLALPTYPFQHKHYWLEPRTLTATAPVEAIHPLVEQLAVRSRDVDVYTTRFEVGKQWILTEHLINGRSVVPGTGLIEMMYTAASHTLDSERLELGDILLQAPAVVTADDPVEAQVVVHKTPDRCDIEVISRSQDEDWTVHATAWAALLEDLDQPASRDIAAIRTTCAEESLVIDLAQEQGGFRFGPRWRNVDSIVHNKDQEVLTGLRIGPDYEPDLDVYWLHPALLDNAINIAAEYIIQNATHTMFLPFACKSLKVYKRLPGEFTSHQAIRNPIERTMGAAILDINLYDVAGEVICSFEKYSLKRVTQELFGDSLYHQVAYRELAPVEVPLAPKAREILLFGADQDQLTNLTDLLQPECERLTVIGVKPGWSETDYAQAVAQTKATDLDVVIFANGYSLTEPSSSSDFLAQQELVLNGFANLVKALAAAHLIQPVRIEVIAKGAVQATANDVVDNPMGAALFALARVVGNEHARFTTACLDLGSQADLAAVPKEVRLPIGPTVIARRGAVRYGEVLEEVKPATVRAHDVAPKESGVYLVTGGIDGIASAVIEAMSAGEVKPTFAVLSRTEVPAPQSWDQTISGPDQRLARRLARLQEFTASGIRLVPVTADVADLERMTAVVNELREQFGSINGVIHGAGVPGKSYLAFKPLEVFTSVLRPKTLGTWVLDQVTRTDQLDFFVVFSSIISVFGPAGQSDYAAANGYQNAYAAVRRARDGIGNAIAWSVWEQSGMAADSDADQIRGVFESLSDAQGAEAFTAVIGRDLPAVLVGVLDADRYKAAGGQIGLPVDAAIAKRLGSGEAKTAAGPTKRQVKVIAPGPSSEIELEVASIWGTLQGLEEVDVQDPLSESGGDSIVLSQYVNALNASFGEVVDISDLYAYPTVRQLADYIARTQAPTQEERPAAMSVEDVMAQVERGDITLEQANDLLEAM